MVIAQLDFVLQSKHTLHFLNLDLGHLIDTTRLLGYSHFKKLFVLDDLLLDHVRLPHVLVLVVHLGHFIGWVGRRDHFKTFLLLALLALHHG